jgi:hypothetical protein
VDGSSLCFIDSHGKFKNTCSCKRVLRVPCCFVGELVVPVAKLAISVTILLLQQ